MLFCFNIKIKIKKLVLFVTTDENIRGSWWRIKTRTVAQSEKGKAINYKERASFLFFFRSNQTVITFLSNYHSTINDFFSWQLEI